MCQSTITVRTRWRGVASIQGELMQHPSVLEKVRPEVGRWRITIEQVCIELRAVGREFNHCTRRNYLFRSILGCLGSHRGWLLGDLIEQPVHGPSPSSFRWGMGAHFTCLFGYDGAQSG